MQGLIELSAWAGAQPSYVTNCGTGSWFKARLPAHAQNVCMVISEDVLLRKPLKLVHVIGGPQKLVVNVGGPETWPIAKAGRIPSLLKSKYQG